MSFQIHSCDLHRFQIISPLKTVRIEGSYTGMVLRGQHVLRSFMIYPCPSFQPDLGSLLPMSSMIQTQHLFNKALLYLYLDMTIALLFYCTVFLKVFFFYKVN